MEVWPTSAGFWGLQLLNLEVFSPTLKILTLNSQALDFTILLAHEFCLTIGSAGSRSHLLMFLYETAFGTEGGRSSLSTAILKSIHNHLHDSHLFCCPKLLKSL